MKRFPSFWRSAAPAGLLLALAATAPAETFIWNKASTAPSTPPASYNWHWRDADNWNSAGGGVPGAGDTANINIDFTSYVNITFGADDNGDYPSVGLLNIGDANGMTPIYFNPGGSGVYLTFDNLGSEARMTKTGVNTVDFRRSVSFKDDTVFDVQEGVVTFTTGNASLRGDGDLAIQGAGLTIFANTSTAGISASFSGDLSIRSHGTLLMNTILNVYSPGNPGVPTPGAIVSVQDTARLGGNGTLGRHTTVESGGRLTPGETLEGAAVLAFTDGLTLEAGSHFDFQLLSNTALPADRGTVFDGVEVSGGVLSLAEGALFNISFDTAGSSVDFTEAFWNVDQEWLVFSGAGVSPANLFTLGSVSLDSAGNSIGGELGFRLDDNALYLTYTAVPEPGTTALLLMVGGLAAAAWRRKLSSRS